VNAMHPDLQKKKAALLLISPNSARLITYKEDYMEALLAGDVDKAPEMAAGLQALMPYFSGLLRYGIGHGSHSTHECGL